MVNGSFEDGELPGIKFNAVIGEEGLELVASFAHLRAPLLCMWGQHLLHSPSPLCWRFRFVARFPCRIIGFWQIRQQVWTSSILLTPVR